MLRTFGVEAFRRYLTLKTHRIHTLPIIILMPHSGCNCRCVMCDIWKGNANQQQLSEADIKGMLTSFRQLGTQWVVLSGGEALMNPNLFRFCDILKAQGLRITVLSTGLLLGRYAAEIVTKTDEIVVSLDGSKTTHDAVRRVPRAYDRLREGIAAVKAIDSTFPVTGRCVIQRLNFKEWPDIVSAAHEIGLDQISFLAADVSTDAFNRPDLWDEGRVADVNLEASEVPEMKLVLEKMIRDYKDDFDSDFIAESPDKLLRIYDYYAALHDKSPFPPVQCNAPWVSAVVEADGTVRPCFFHRPMGNIGHDSLAEMLNKPEEILFRKNLDLERNPICRKCVCTLNLRPTVSLRPRVVKSV